MARLREANVMTASVRCVDAGRRSAITIHVINAENRRWSHDHVRLRHPHAKPAANPSRELFTVILKFFKSMLSGNVYAQLSEEKIRIYNLDNGSVYDQRPFIAINKSNPKQETVWAIGDDAYRLRSDGRFHVSNPFSHPRLLVSNFIKAEKVLMYGIHQVRKGRHIVPGPVLIVHPMDRLEGGVTDIECRVYRELGLGAGARKVYLHVGDPLSTTRFEPERIREPVSD